MLYWAAVLVVLTLLETLAQDRDCDYSQKVLPGRTYYVYSPGYPGSYRGGVTCRWLAACPPGHRCRLECPTVDLPESDGCVSDHLLVSRRGDPQLTAAERYCGAGTLRLDSRGQKLSVGLVTYQSSDSRGKFYCRLTAAADAGGNGTCVCGVRNAKRIVNGQDAGAGEYPMMAGLTNRRSNEVYCGGTIVSQQYVVTAAHCRLDLSLQDIGVAVGKLYSKNDKNEVVYSVREFRVHPKYDESTYNNDIALVRTAAPMRFDFGVSPACLPFRFRDYDFTGEKVTALGWGTLFPGGPTADALQKVDLDVISRDRCRRTEDVADQLCTYTPGKDSCQFDSGGPLLYQERTSGRQYLVAVVSRGYFCASDRPGVNTRVTDYLGWIADNAQADFCKL